MAITVQFLLNWLSIVIPNYEKSVSNYRKAKKGKKPKEIIELIYDACLNEARKNNDIEIEPHFHDSHVHKTFRFNNFARIKGAIEDRNTASFELQFLPAVRPPAKRKGINDLSEAPTTSKRSLRNAPCENLNCTKLVLENEKLKERIKELEQNAVEYETRLRDLNSKLNSSSVSDLSIQLSQARVKGSQRTVLDGSQNKLFKIDQNGCIIQYSTAMMTLGLTLLLLNIPANSIPVVLALIFRSAGFDGYSCPQFNYFRRLRFCLVPLNLFLIQNFIADAVNLALNFDETTLSTRLGHVLAVTLMNQNAQSIVIGIIEHEERGAKGTKAEIDVEAIIQVIKNLFRNEETCDARKAKFEETCNKIQYVLSDSCNAASKTNRLLAAKLDTIAPLSSPRKSLKCLAHIAGLLEKHAFVKLPLITGFTKKIAAHFSKPSGLAKDTNHALWQARSRRKFLYSTGERFFFNGQNALIAYLEFDNLRQIASETAPSSNGSKAILQLMKEPELKIQLAISAGLTCPIRELWTNLTKTTTRRGLSDKIGDLKARIQRLESGELKIIDLIKSISVGDADAIQGRDLFVESHGENPDMLLRLNEIYLNIVGQMMPFLESFENVNQERGDEIVDPTNVPVERVFGVLKYAEKALPNLQFGLLAQHTMAKFNKVSDALPNIDPAKLDQFHSEVSIIEKRMKQDHLDQQANILAAARRVRDEAQLTDQRIQPAANYIMEHRNLLPKPDFSDRSSNVKQLNLSLKEHFGERQYTIICLEALKIIIENEHNAYFIHQNYMVAKTSSPDEKLKSALHLYHYLVSK